MLDLIKLLAVLAGILILLWHKWNLGIALVLASAAIGLLFGRSPAGLLEDAVATAINTTTIRLGAIVTLILSMGALLKASAKLEGMVHSMEVLFSDNRVTLAVIPALIGVLPMVGGAMFSAPMVDEIGDHLKVDNSRKTFVNYWFRHVWEWVLPIYPSLIVAATLLETTPRELTLAQWPLTVMAVAAGVVFGLRPIRRQSKPISNGLDRSDNLKLLFASIWPILMVITLAIPLQLDLIASLLITIALLVAVNRMSLKETWQILHAGVSLQSVLLIASVLFFRQVLESTGAVAEAPAAMTSAGIPVPLVIFFIPMLAGLLTGLAVGAFGVGFPVVMPLIAAGGMDMGTMVLAYSGAFLGVMLSPLHLCFSLTRDYFKAEWGANYRLLVPSVAAVAIAGMCVFILR